MIFYNGNLVDWKNDRDELSNDIRRTITEFKSKHFGEDKKGFCQIRYPNGIRVKNQSGYYEPKKAFFLDLVSSDGIWRWSDRVPRNGRFSYPNGNHFKVEDSFHFTEENAELAWFLEAHSPQFKSGKVYFEDFEVAAEKEAKKRIEDVEISYAIYSHKSPVANKIGLLRDVADIFGVENVKKLTKHELKNSLFDAIKQGEKNGSKYVNLKKFEEITDSEAKLRAARIVRKAIHNDELKYKHSDKTWYSCDNGNYIEPLLKLKPNETANKEEVLLEKVLDDKTFKGKVYAELGVSDYTTRSEVEELGYNALIKMCSDEGIVLKDKKMETAVAEYCNKMGIDS